MIRGFVFAVLIVGCSPSPDAPAEHLRVIGDRIETVHGLRYIITGSDFHVAGPVHRSDTFDGHPYEISLAGLIGEGGAVMVHAERVADGSGASNYDDLPTAAWPSPDFHRRFMCVTLAEDDITGEHDLEWLRANSFDPLGSIALEQLLTTSADHNEEVVVSLIVKGLDCADEAGVAAALDRFRRRVSVDLG